MSERLEQVRALLAKEYEEREPSLARDILVAAYGLVGDVINADERDAEAASRAAKGLPRVWTPITKAELPPSEGRKRRRFVYTGDVVKVRGLGKRLGAPNPPGTRGIGGGWKITGMAQRDDEVNVIVFRNGKEYTVKIDRIA